MFSETKVNVHLILGMDFCTQRIKNCKVLSMVFGETLTFVIFWFVSEKE